MDVNKFSYDSMGTHWEISIWDQSDPICLEQIRSDILERSTKFDKTYSRFIKSSLVWKIAESSGVYKVPRDMTKMLDLYKDLYEASDRKLNPLIGFMISDMGYDANYSLHPKDIIRLTPDFNEALEIIDETHIRTNQKVLIDLGALGKGYFVDRITDLLKSRGIVQFLVNGSGDIRYEGSEKIQVGLEHPIDKTKVIGKIEMTSGSMCASGTDRRKWNIYNHVVDPIELKSVQEIIATWVIAENTALADALATCLFFNPPEKFKTRYSFEYLVLNKDFGAERSVGFNAELY